MIASTRSHTPLTQIARWFYLITTWLFAAGVTAQVFAIGMVLLGGQGQWLEHHQTLGLAMSLLPLLTLLSTPFAKLPRTLVLGAGALFLLYIAQYLLVVVPAPTSAVRAFHAVNAPIMFYLAGFLGYRVLTLLRRER